MKPTSTIRVFPRKTNWTPSDDLVFFDEPPLFEIPHHRVAVSVTFSWDRARGERLYETWSSRVKNVEIGGPAYQFYLGEEFEPGLFIKKGITITSRGCPKNCPYCLVPHGKRPFELEIKPGYIVQDDNLLACTKRHILKVFKMLEKQDKGIIFKGGLDLDFLSEWHIELLKSIKINEIWVAFDSERSLENLQKARDLLSDFSIEKRRCYVLAGFGNDTPQKAEKRLQEIYNKGFLPFVQFYQPPEPQKRAPCSDWLKLIRKWSRPAIYRSKKGEKPC